MGVFNKDKDATQPLKTEEVIVPEVVAEEVPDRRHYNCIPCKGEGLVKNGWAVDEVCTECNGTGKVGQ